jgi:hypothetical protein
MKTFKDTPNAPAPIELYERMKTAELEALRAAFEADAAAAGKGAETVAFCRGRLKAIDEVLAARAGAQGAQ